MLLAMVMLVSCEKDTISELEQSSIAPSALEAYTDSEEVVFERSASCGFSDFAVSCLCVSFTVNEEQGFTYTIDMGDGTILAGPNGPNGSNNSFSYCYPVAGNYNVVLTYLNQQGVPQCGATNPIRVDVCPEGCPEEPNDECSNAYYLGSLDESQELFEEFCLDPIGEFDYFEFTFQGVTFQLEITGLNNTFGDYYVSINYSPGSDELTIIASNISSGFLADMTLYRQDSELNPCSCKIAEGSDPTTTFGSLSVIVIQGLLAKFGPCL